MGSVSVRSQCRSRRASLRPGESGRRRGGVRVPTSPVLPSLQRPGFAWGGGGGVDRNAGDSPAEILISAKLLFHSLVWFGF